MAKRPERLRVDDLIHSNPNVDPEQLEKGRELLRQLRKNRSQDKRDKLDSPTRRRVTIDDKPSKDPRTVQLRNRG